MRNAMFLIRNRLDRVGVLLSGLCALHCIAGLLLVAGLGLSGEVLFAPAIHRIGLALAIVVGAITLVFGVIRHGDPRPLQVGAAGLGLMIVVTSSPASDAWRRTARISDPTLTRIGVFTATTSAAQRGRLGVDASDLQLFRANWHRLAGARGLDRSRTPAEAPSEVGA